MKGNNKADESSSNDSPSIVNLSLIKTQRKHQEAVQPSLALCPFVLPKTNILGLTIVPYLIFWSWNLILYFFWHCKCITYHQVVSVFTRETVPLSKIHTLTLRVCLWEQIIFLLTVLSIWSPTLCCILESRMAYLYHLPICQNETVVLGECWAVIYAKVNYLFSILLGAEEK